MINRLWPCLFICLMGAVDAIRADVFEHPVSASSANATALRELARELSSQGEVRGEFVQEKFLAILDRPLRSRGSFTLSGKNSFVWRVHEPFAVSYRFVDGNLYRRDDEGERLVKPAADPMLYGFFAFFSTLFELSPTELEKLFRLYFEQRGDRWTLGLEPRETMLQSALTAIVVDGEVVDAATRAEHRVTIAITKVTIRESGGDYSQLLFSY